jgi:hypothetical protein
MVYYFADISEYYEFLETGMSFGRSYLLSLEVDDFINKKNVWIIM